MRLEFLPFIILFAFAPKMLHGQYIPMVEEGKYWIYLNYYISSHEDYLPVSGHAITFQGDTIINSLGYKKVYRLHLKGYNNCPFPPCFKFYYPYQIESMELISFIREDTLQKKIFNLPVLSYGFCDTTEHLIFDYSLTIGDTINSCIYDFIMASYIVEIPAGIVDSIDTIKIYGKNRNTIFTTGSDNYFQDPAIERILIVEGVGLETFGLFLDPLSPLVDFCEGGMEPCQLLSSNSGIENPKQINIFPNPTKGILQISAEEAELKSIRICSMMGVFKSEFLNTNTIDLSNLEGGIYIMELTSKNGGRVVKKVIKEN